jgi:serine protease Do
VTRKPILVAMLAATLAIVPIAYGFFGSNAPGQTSTNSLWVELSAENAKLNQINIPSLAPLVKKAAPAVLVVTTESVVKQQQMQMPPGFEQGPMGDFFRFFGPGPGPRGQMPEQKSKGQGSGFIIHPSGFALTNNHVVEGASSIKVKIGTELKEYDAEVIGSDEDTDVALIKIKSDKKDWPVLPLGNSTALEVGDFAVAIGNPLGLELSVSMGIVSARGRRDIHPSGRSGLFDFIQIDAPINPGNSGGPLINLAGEVVGINTAISAAGQGIAFAIPVDQVKQILPQLKEKGHATRSGMGVRIENVSSELAKSLGLAYAYGALVREVMPGSSAQKAGIEAGDVVTEFDGKTVKDAASLQVMAGLAGVGKSVPLTVFRDGVAKKLKITLEELQREGKSGKAIPKSKKEDTVGVESLGISVDTLDDATRKQLLMEKDVVGARVVKIDPESMAAFAGIELNDVIISVNKKPIKNAAALNELVKGTKKGEILRILLRRQRATIFVAIPKP